MPDYPLNPECRNGDCHKCRGDAWNEQTDTPCWCQCVCHGEGAEQ